MELKGTNVKELMRTVNPVDLSFAQDLLGQHGIESFVFDENMSVLEGSIGALIPRRLVVADDHYERAKRLLKDEGIEPYDGKPW